ncbi:MAG: hypothetical protein K8T90_11590 [Planctomycetes bacterium]|nr:hypothetical protein [Planctomycetota bacterium]
MPRQSPADPAIALFERRVAEDERDSGSWAVLAHLRVRAFDLHGDVADLARAEVAARRSLAIDPANAQATALLVRALSAMHRDADALLVCDAFAEAHGGAAQVSAAAASAAFDAGRWGRAEKEAGALGGGEPDAAAMLVRARFVELRGDGPNAAERARNAARAAAAAGMLPHEVAACHVAAGAIAFRAGRIDDARADFERAVTSCPDYGPGIGGLADVAAADGRLADADRLATAAATLRPAPRELAQRAQIAALRGDHAAAARAALVVRAACEAHPDVYGAELADLIARAPSAANANADLAHALELIDAAVAVRPTPQNHAVRARVLLALARPADAAAAVTEARRMGTRTPLILETSARVALALGRRDAAAEDVARLRAIHPTFVPADLAKEFPR